MKVVTGRDLTSDRRPSTLSAFLKSWGEFLNPIDWIAWLHGRFFVNTPLAGYVLAALAASLIAVLFWMRGVEKYNETRATPQPSATRSMPEQPTVIYRQLEEDPYRVGPGKPAFRIDTLDGDLNKAGLMRGQPFDGLSPPQLKPTPENDTNPAEYFLLKNGLYLRATRPRGGTITEEQRAKAHAVILAHEARLKY